MARRRFSPFETRLGHPALSFGWTNDDQRLDRGLLIDREWPPSPSMGCSSLARPPGFRAKGTRG
jgi:hypothetical protein